MIDAADYAVLQDYVAGRKEMLAYSGKAPRVNRVDVGAVDMSTTDLQELKTRTSWMKGGPAHQLLEKLHAGSK